MRNWRPFPRSALAPEHRLDPDVEWSNGRDFLGTPRDIPLSPVESSPAPEQLTRGEKLFHLWPKLTRKKDFDMKTAHYY